MSVMTQRADILVVDDDPGMLETLGDVLAREGHRVHAANRGSAALSRLIQTPSMDVAIVDFKLPDITGYGSLATALEAIEGQVASYLVKPLDVGHLLKTVEQALARQRLARALRESEERYRLVTDALTEAVLLLNPSGHVVLANRYAETLTAYDHPAAPRRARDPARRGPGRGRDLPPATSPSPCQRRETLRCG